VGAAAASANDSENNDGGDKDWETVACPHGFYLTHIEKIMTSKCVPEAVAACPSNKGVTLKQPASCVTQAVCPLLWCLLIQDFCVFGVCARCDARAGSFGHRLKGKVLLNSRPIYNRRLVVPHNVPGAFHP
jgi:hypothetical protein